MAEEKSFLDFLWDTGKSVVKRVSEIELEKLELERLADLRRQEEAARTDEVMQLAGYEIQRDQANMIAGWAAVGSVLLIGTAAILMMKG